MGFKMCLRFETQPNVFSSSAETKSKRWVFHFSKYLCQKIKKVYTFLNGSYYNLRCYKFQQTKPAALLFDSFTEVSEMDSPRRGALGDAHFYCSTGSPLALFFVVYDYYHYKSSKPNTKVPQ